MLVTNKPIGAESQLKIESKKLKSGKCQVKFYLTVEKEKKLYGYTLVDSSSSLKEVVREIKAKLEGVGGYENYYQNNLYSIKRNNQKYLDNLVLFKN